jgi:serine/threonine-protein kinase
MDEVEIAAGVYVFGSFRLDPVRRVLTRHTMPVDLSARLFDTLVYLVQHHDRPVTRDELERAVWGARTIDGTSVAVAISSLRKVLQEGDGYGNLIVNIPGQGYRLIASVIVEPARARRSAPAYFPPPTAAQLPAGSRASWRRFGAVPLALLLTLAISGAAVWYVVPQRGGAVGTAPPFAPPPHSVAVMAFTNLSRDPGQAYFSDGLAEELINSLSQVRALRVAARGSSFSFKGCSTSVLEIARRLNVGNVLQGSVRRAGNHLVISLQLIDGQTGNRLWSHVYDRDEGDMFNLQAELADAVVSALQVTLAGPDVARLTLGGTSNPRAFDAFLRALAAVQFSNDSDEENKKVITLFDEAVSLDPAFAVAQARRAYFLWSTATNSSSNDRVWIDNLHDAAVAGATKAVALAPDLAWAHLALGYALGGRFPSLARQEAEFARARDLARGDTTVLGLYADFESQVGHTAFAVEAAEQAAALDPLKSGSYDREAWVYYFDRRWNDALAAVTRARELGSHHIMELSYLRGLIALMQGHPGDAVADCTGDPDPRMNLCLAIAYHALGRQSEAAAQLAKLDANLGDAGPYNYAEVYAQWGRPDDALRALDKAFSLPDLGIIGMKTDPLLDPIRATAHFKELEERLDHPA